MQCRSEARPIALSTMEHSHPPGLHSTSGGLYSSSSRVTWKFTLLLLRLLCKLHLSYFRMNWLLFLKSSDPPIPDASVPSFSYLSEGCQSLEIFVASLVFTVSEYVHLSDYQLPSAEHSRMSMSVYALISPYKMQF